MADYPEAAPVYPRSGTLASNDFLVSKYAWLHCCANSVFTASTAWGTANLALYMPVMVEVPSTVYRMTVTNGTVVNGNFQLGIYTEKGVQLVASASTAQAGVSAIQSLDITDTNLTPGVYYLAIASNSTTATFTCGASTLNRQSGSGICEQTSAFTLPTPATVGTASTRLFCPIVTASYVATV